MTVISDDDQEEDPEDVSPVLVKTSRHGHQGQVLHRRPATIASDDDQDFTSNDDEGNSADEGGNDDEAEEPIDDSLQNLEAKELKYTLQKEVSAI
jgi:hypothetical protein